MYIGFLSNNVYLAFNFNSYSLQDGLCGLFESCARCWPGQCETGDCSPQGLDNLSKFLLNLLVLKSLDVIMWPKIKLLILAV